MSPQEMGVAPLTPLGQLDRAADYFPERVAYRFEGAATAYSTMAGAAIRPRSPPACSGTTWSACSGGRVKKVKRVTRAVLPLQSPTLRRAWQQGRRDWVG